MKPVYSIVEAELGGGRVICDRCHATLETFADVCSAGLLDQCQGFLAIDKAKADAEAKCFPKT